MHLLITDTDVVVSLAASASAGMVQGSLQCPEDPKMGEHLAFLMGRSSRDARMYLRKWLREALRQAGIQPKTRSKAGRLPSFACSGSICVSHGAGPHRNTGKTLHIIAVPTYEV